MINNIPISYYITSIRLLYDWTLRRLHTISSKSLVINNDQTKS